MMRDDLFDLIETADLSGDAKWIAEQCGIDVAMAIVKTFPGIQLSIPKVPYWNFVRRYVVAHASYDKRRLALELGITEAQVKIILNGEKDADSGSDGSSKAA